MVVVCLNLSLFGVNLILELIVGYNPISKFYLRFNWEKIEKSHIFLILILEQWNATSLLFSHFLNLIFFSFISYLFSQIFKSVAPRGRCSYFFWLSSILGFAPWPSWHIPRARVLETCLENRLDLEELCRFLTWPKSSMI